MDRRKFLIGMGSLAAGSAAAMGTGAFTTMTAERSANINVVNDSAGLVGLISDGEQVWEDNGQLYINTSIGNGDAGSDEGSYGVNQGSTYQFGETEDATWDAENYQGEGAGAAGYFDVDSKENSYGEWYGTHFSGETEEETARAWYSASALGSLPGDGSNTVVEPFFTVQNNDSQAHDIRLTFDDEIVSALGETMDVQTDDGSDELYLEFEGVGPGEVVDIALVVLAGDSNVDAEGSITVSAD
jgi:hypothetical protein